ncbi:MAG: GntR family transcriptional regulator [bacterium]|nr:GntR family transcriptional regulator [Acidimicrobiia bacterium]MCY4648973.1 GntR family transcriptional regulator [bacterium]
MFRTLEDYAYSTIREAILMGELKSGERILLKDLEATYRISRTPIRQALRRLAERGYVTLQPHSSMRVRPLSLEEVNELYALRQAIEPIAMAEGMGGADDSVMALLESLLGQMHVATENEDRLTLIGLNAKFHRSMYEPSHMPHLLSIYDRLLGICERYQWMQAGAPVAQLRRDRRHHEEILDAYRGRDEERAIELIQIHLEQARAAILQHLNTRGDPIT